MNLPLFSLSLIRAYWKLGLAMIVGAALIWPLAACQGRRSAEAASAAKIIAASAKVREAASKAEMAATLSEMARSASTTRQAEELREIVAETKSDAGVGPATAAVLRRLRQNRSR